MNPSGLLHDEPNSTSTLLVQPRVLVVKRHHILVRWSHWLNVPLLLGLVLSGISIYWSSPVYQHKPDPVTGNFDVAADIGDWICAHVPGQHHYTSPPDWLYNHMSLGPGMLAPALRIHWLCAYLFMLNGTVYVVGLRMGEGWRSLLPRWTDPIDTLRMFRYYLGAPFAKLTRRQWPHPHFNTKYNPLQRAAYCSVPVTGFLSVATGWAIHKPMQLHWLAAIFGGFDASRVWHFWLMWLFIFFVVPHVILVFADGWDTLRSMIVGWSTKVERPEVSAMNNEENGNSLEPENILPTSTVSKEGKAALPDVSPGDANPSVPLATENTACAAALEHQAAPVESPSAPVDREPRTVEAAVLFKQEMATLPEASSEEANLSVQNASEKPAATETTDQVAQDGSSAPLVEQASRTDGLVSSIAVKPVVVSKYYRCCEEQALPVVEMAPHMMRYRTRREVLAFGIGVAAATGAGYLLPQNTLNRLGVRRDLSSRGKEWLLNNALRVDDDVAEALYSHNRMVPTYTKSQITPIKNNYNGVTPDAGYLSGWNLTLEGLASGLSVRLDIRMLINRFPVRDQITRFVCVEGWSAIAWWSGPRFDDLLRAYPPKSQAKWARVESSVNLDNTGKSDPYFVSIDLATARHPQTLLATHHDGQRLTVEHGAPLRLLVPVKLGLKNVKAITRITYSTEEPRDYWAQYGYSSYDGI